MFTKSLSRRRAAQAVAVALALSVSGAAFASDYFLVVPVKGRAVAPPAIDVALAPTALPAAALGEKYTGFDFNSALRVTGDADFKAAGVSWAVVAGNLPAGLTLGADGRLSGTPTQGGTASFTVRATYRTKSGQQAYELVASQLEVALAARARLLAPEGSAITYDFKPQLTVGGSTAYDASKVTWSAVGALPPGLSLSAAGVLSGTPILNDEGASFSLKAAYGAQSGQQTYTVLPSDPAYGNVSLLMHLDGTNGSMVFPDARGKAFTPAGGPVISTSASKFGSAALRLNGSSYIESAANAAFILSGDFTVEFWTNLSAHGTYGGLLSYAHNSTGAGWQIIFERDTNHLRVETTGGPAMVSSTPLPMNTWAHVALVRSGTAANNMRLFINGVKVAEMSQNVVLDSGGQKFHIGVERIGSYTSTGYFDEVRITQNVARYLGNFTPPAVSHASR